MTTSQLQSSASNERTSESPSSSASASASASASPLVAHRILCYGDSLTAGTSPPLMATFPYGVHLERVLNEPSNDGSKSRDNNNNNNDNDDDEKGKAANIMVPQSPAIVRWRGMPGWTSDLMVQFLDDSTTGLQSAVQKVTNPSLSVVIILAGTNDLGYGPSSPDAIASNIIALHQVCHELGVKKTVAVGIPPSAWQAQNDHARHLARGVNDALKEYCEKKSANNTRSGSGRQGVPASVYVPFPFTWQREDKRWASDGLHLSPAGYEALGVGLAPAIRQVLDNIESEQREARSMQGGESSCQVL